MTDLLKRWGELEPAWCHVDDERAGVMTDVGTPLERLRFKAQFHRLGQYEPLILAAVIEAIEARGWRLTLVHNPWREERPKWGAWLSRYEEGDLALARRDHEADTPAEAILSAYLAALEAEAGQ